MEADKHSPQSEHRTEEEKQGGGSPPAPTEAPPTESEPPKEKLQGFAASFAEFLKDQRENPDRDFLAEEVQRSQERRAAKIKAREGRQTYFFYGTLMDPGIAQKVLGMEEPPAMRPALLRNRGHLKLWGPFPAFVADQEPTVDVRGVACEIEGADRKDRLAAYEGWRYEERLFFIDLLGEDGSTVTESIMAKAFAWMGDDDELDDGTFDLVAYKAAKEDLEAAEK